MDQPIPCQRWGGRRRHLELERGKLSPRDGIFHQTVSRLPVANWAFLASWTDDICQEGWSQWSAPQKRHTAHLRWRTWKPSGWDGGGYKTHHQAGSMRASTWSPELLGPRKGTQPKAHFRKFLHRATWSLSSVDWESTHAVSGGKPSVAETLWAPHTRQWDLSAVPLPPHSTTQQVSLEKWPPPPPCVRMEIRHWRDQQTKEAKINRSHFGSDRFNRLKPRS